MINGTREVQDLGRWSDLLECLRAGTPMRSACAAVGIPYRSVLAIVRDGEAMAEAEIKAIAACEDYTPDRPDVLARYRDVSAAEAVGRSRALSVIMRAINDEDLDMDKRLRAAQWYLARCGGPDYREQSAVDITIDEERGTDEQVESIVQRLERAAAAVSGGDDG